jgi:hypothetical protein
MAESGSSILVEQNMDPEVADEYELVSQFKLFQYYFVN